MWQVTCNSNGNGRADGSVHLDHDYCSSVGSALSTSDGNADYERQLSDSDKCLSSNKDDVSKQQQQQHQQQQQQQRSSNLDNCRIAGKKLLSKYYRDSWTDHNSKKDSGLESGDVSDASEELPAPAVKQAVSISNTNTNTKTKSNEVTIGIGIGMGIGIGRHKEQQQDSLLKQTNNSIVSKLNNIKSVMKPSPVHEMKIRSALATSILQLRKGVITKTKPVLDGVNARRPGAYIVGMETGNPKVKQMVSVLKKPPNCATSTSSSTLISSNPKESIVTTTNSSNGEVQNIIVQEVEQVNEEEEELKKPVRRKLNLAEYRSRRDKNRSDNSRTNSPVQPMTLIYIHHVSTTTEPIKDDPENPVWSEREIVSVLKPKADIEEEKNRPKVVTHEIGIQTNETVFDSPAQTNTTVSNEKRFVSFRGLTVTDSSRK